MFTSTQNILSLWNKMYSTKGSHDPQPQQVSVAKPLLKETDTAESLEKSKSDDIKVSDGLTIMNVDGKRYVVPKNSLTHNSWEKVRELGTGQRVLLRSKGRDWTSGTIFKDIRDAFVINDCYNGSRPEVPSSFWSRWGKFSWGLFSQDLMRNEGTELLLIEEVL